jgi:maltose O-acetyltransferase
MGVHVRNVVVNLLAACYVLPNWLRPWLLRRCGIAVGPGTTIRSRCTFDGLNVSFGAGCYVSYRCSFNASAPIEIADKVSIAHCVKMVTATHEIGGPDRRAGASRALPVAVGRGCWIGAGATLLPGVRVADGCVIAAGAVVASDCEANGLYAGVPAQRIRDLPAAAGRSPSIPAASRSPSIPTAVGQGSRQQ